MSETRDTGMGLLSYMMREMNPMDSQPEMSALTIIASFGIRDKSLRTRNSRKIRKILSEDLRGPRDRYHGRT